VIEISGRRQWEVGVDGEDTGPYFENGSLVPTDRDRSVSSGDDGDKEGDGIH